MSEMEIKRLLETEKKCVSEIKTPCTVQQPINPIAELLSTLSPGEGVDRVFINANSESVDAFVSFNAATGLATFVKHKGRILAADASRIDALIFN